MTHLTDAELVSCVCDGDKDAYGHLVERHRFMAYSIAKRIIGNEAVVQELIQEAMLQAYLSIGQLRNRAQFRSWLYSIVSNTCKNHIRTQKINMYSLNESLDNGYRLKNKKTRSFNPQDIAETQELRDHLVKAFDSLSKINRTVASKFYYEQLSYKTIAQQLDLSVASVKNRLYRSRKQLMNLLEKVYPDIVRDILSELRRKAMVKVMVADVVQKSDLFFVVLLDESGQRLLSVQVGLVEGLAIRQELAEVGEEGYDFIAADMIYAKPPVLNLMANLLEETGIELQSVHVEVLKENILCGVAKVWSGGMLREVEARPSDVILLALRTGSPIYIHEDVLNRAGEEILEDFRDVPERMFPGRKILEQAALLNSHYKTLEKLHEPVCDMLAATFAERINEDIQVSIAYVDGLFYRDLVMAMAKPAWACTFALHPEGSKALLDISPKVANFLMNAMGNDDIDSILEKILEDLELAWNMSDLSVGSYDRATDPKAIGLANDDASVFIVALEVKWSDSYGLMWLCYPNETIIESVLPRLG